MHVVQCSYSSGKHGRGTFLKNEPEGQPGKLREFSDYIFTTSGNFILPNISDQIGGALRMKKK